MRRTLLPLLALGFDDGIIALSGCVLLLLDGLTTVGASGSTLSLSVGRRSGPRERA